MSRTRTDLLTLAGRDFGLLSNTLPIPLWPTCRKRFSDIKAARAVDSVLSDECVRNTSWCPRVVHLNGKRIEIPGLMHTVSIAELYRRYNAKFGAEACIRKSAFYEICETLGRADP